jgi:DNA-binding MarR family transcriptional regulator
VSGGTGEGALPLPTLLSEVLVAFTIEFDNESERTIQHWTTRADPSRKRQGVWLASQAMWANFMRFIPAEGIRLGEVEALAQLTNLGGLERWRYVELRPSPGDGRVSPPRSDWIVRPTRAGLRAQQIWEPMAGVIEQRWKGRFGDEAVGRLREVLAGLAARAEGELPPYLPVVAIDMRANPDQLRAGAVAARRLAKEGSRPDDDLSALLSRVLLMFTLDFETGSRLSLPISANALRVLGEAPVRLRDIPRLSGVSKEAVAMAIGLLSRIDCVAVEADASASRGKTARLTEKGHRAQEKYRRLLRETEAAWRERFGGELAELRSSLEALVGGGGATSPLLKGLAPYPDGWRAKLRAPETLPHYPMVLHRGGWPDGS